MFERFTVGAREAISLAQEEARTLHHRSIGTEHLLLGLLRLPESVGYKVLVDLGTDTEGLRELLLTLIDTRPERRQLPNDPEVVAVLGRAVDLALSEGAEKVELKHLRAALEGP